MRDLKDSFSVDQSLKPAAAHTSSPTCTSSDLQGFGGALVVINPGVITDGTHTPKLQESDDDSSYSDVAAADLVGSFAAIASSTAQKVGYVGIKRYVKLVITVSGTTSGGFYSAVTLKGLPSLGPAA